MAIHTTSFSSCKHPAWPLTIGGVNVAGCDRHDRPEHHAASMILLDSDTWGSKTVRVNLGRWANVLQVAQSTMEVLSVPWKDYGLPPQELDSADAWRNVWSVVVDVGDTAVISCQGGHGRTGTAMAALLVAVEGMDPGAAIEKVRKRYCTKAIETWEQSVYVYHIAGAKPPSYTESTKKLCWWLSWKAGEDSATLNCAGASCDYTLEVSNAALGKDAMSKLSDLIRSDKAGNAKSVWRSARDPEVWCWSVPKGPRCIPADNNDKHIDAVRECIHREHQRREDKAKNGKGTKKK